MAVVSLFVWWSVPSNGSICHNIIVNIRSFHVCFHNLVSYSRGYSFQPVKVTEFLLASANPRYPLNLLT
jgi:hypothetical protein